MKILHVLRAPAGGLLRHVVDLAKGQIDRGHSIGIIAGIQGGNVLSELMLSQLAPQLELGIVRLAIKRQPSPSDINPIWQVSRRIYQTSAEVLHGHGAKGGALARLAPASKAIIRAYTPHGGSLHGGPGSTFHIMLERALKSRGDLYLFESQYSCEQYLRKIGTPNALFRVVHNGVSQDDFETIPLNADATDLIYFGELRDLKGVDVLIDAIAHLRRTGRAVTATIIGDGSDEAKFRQQVTRLCLSDIVRFYPSMHRHKALACGRIVVVPSRAESLPYTVLETLASEKPLIATNVGGIPEVFGSMSHRLVPPDDVGALAEAIAASLASPLGTKLASERLRARIAEEFLAGNMVDRVLNSYERVRAVRNGSASNKESVPLNEAGQQRNWPPTRA